MEEMVGRWWHVALTRLTRPEHAGAAVQLSQMKTSVGMLFRAGGGPSHVRLAEAGLQRTATPNHWLHRLASSGDRAALAVLEPEVLALPPSVAVFSEPALNRDLYLWLALLTAHWAPSGQWLVDNVRATRRALSAFPGFQTRYQRLCDLHLAQRPSVAGLRGRAAAAEQAVADALLGGAPADGGWQAADVAPVWLWVCGATHAAAWPGADPAAPPPPPTNRAPTAADAQRRRAQATTHTQERHAMVLPFRAEALMSWSELVRVNRSSDDEDDGNAIKAANDMEVLSVAQQGQTLAARVKFDLDLPSSSADDTPLGPGRKFPEWDHRRGVLVPDHCLVQDLRARQGAPFVPGAGLRATARQVRRRMEVLRHAPRLQRGQEQGEDIDLDAWIRLQADSLGVSARRSDTPAVYTRQIRGERSLATWLLADLSQSTDAHANDHARVIDVIRDALYVFGEALSAVGDPFAVWGFSSVRRQHVRMQCIKGLDEPWNEDARARVGAIRPGYYTRMGAAIRHATAHLRQCPQRCRLLMLLTDGKPNDLDQYEGRYGLEDTRHAIHEARAAGLIPFCVTIDSAGHDYLPMLFGRQGYALVHRPEDLAHRLTQAWTTLVRSH
ncbi:MAG: nitric oxide reductase [Thiobacillus sp.]|nr:nitric oxide reductase [Thiobacillus sp.]